MSVIDPELVTASEGHAAGCHSHGASPERPYGTQGTSKQPLGRGKASNLSPVSHLSKLVHGGAPPRFWVVLPRPPHMVSGEARASAALALMSKTAALPKISPILRESMRQSTVSGDGR